MPSSEGLLREVEEDAGKGLGAGMLWYAAGTPDFLSDSDINSRNWNFHAKFEFVLDLSASS